MDCEELPFEYAGSEPIQNSEKESKCWYLRDPTNQKQKLQKRVKFALEAGASQEIAVSLKTPMDKLNSKMAA